VIYHSGTGSMTSREYSDVILLGQLTWSKNLYKLVNKLRERITDFREGGELLFIPKSLQRLISNLLISALISQCQGWFARWGCFTFYPSVTQQLITAPTFLDSLRYLRTRRIK
jgi:hypothetical protein